MRDCTGRKCVLICGACRFYWGAGPAYCAIVRRVGLLARHSLCRFAWGDLSSLHGHSCPLAGTQLELTASRQFALRFGRSALFPAAFFEERDCVDAEIAMTPNRALTLLLFVFALTLLLAVAFGGSTLSIQAFLNVLVGGGSAEEQMIVFQFRCPRVVIAALAGCGLGVAGTVLQTVLRNELVDPTSIGISSGAGLGVTVLLLFFPLAPAQAPLLLPFCALAGALLALGLVLFVAHENGAVSPVKLLLIGLMFSITLAAAQLLIGMRMSREIYNFIFAWLVGTLNGLEWKHAAILAPWVLLSVPLFIAQSRSMDVLSLGENEARGVGLNVSHTRKYLAIAAASLGGACVAIVGNIGFLGLIAPHLARRIVGIRHVVLVPAAALCGSCILMLADTLSRRLPTATEIPAGVWVVALGSPYFLLLLLRAKI